MTKKEEDKKILTNNYQSIIENLLSEGIISEKPNFNFEDKSDFNKYREKIKSEITLNYTHLHGTNVSAKQINKIINKYFIIKYEKSELNGQVFIKYYKQNPYSKLYEYYNYLEIGTDIHMICEALGHKGKDLKSLTDNVIYHLDTSGFNDIKQINIAPNNLLMFDNGIFARKANKFLEKNSIEYNQILNIFDFVNMFKFDYLKEIDEKNKYLLVWNKLIKDLSNENEDQKLLFEQITSAVIEGNGRGKYIMMSGQAGSGKTTFSNILANIAGPEYTHHVTLDAISNDYAINNIKSSTKLIIGDDLQKAAKLSNVGLRYFKTLVDGNKLSVAVKFEPHRVIQTSGVWLQMMNDDPSIYEANDAIIDRTILVKIEGRNHRKIKDPGEKEFSRRLDLYTGKHGEADKNFIQTIVSHILNSVDYFDNYHISEKMEQDTIKMINDGNWAYQFVEWLNDMEFLTFAKLPTCDLQVLLYHWIDMNNPYMIKPSSKTIYNELKPYLTKYGFKYNNIQVRLGQSNIIDYNRDLIKSELSDFHKELPSTNKVRFWYNNNNIIQDIEVNNLLNKIESNDLNTDYELLSFKDKIIIKALISYGNPDITIWYTQQTS